MRIRLPLPSGEHSFEADGPSSTVIDLLKLWLGAPVKPAAAAPATDKKPRAVPTPPNSNGNNAAATNAAVLEMLGAGDYRRDALTERLVEAGWARSTVYEAISRLIDLGYVTADRSKGGPAVLRAVTSTPRAIPA